MNLEIKNGLNFDNLPRHQRRQFVSETADLTSLNEIKALYGQLIKREIFSAEDLEKWVLDRSELEAVLDQHGSILYIRMTCQTDDPERVQSYKNFLEKITPAIKPLDDQLNKRYLDEFKMFPLDEQRYGIYTRAIRTDIELYVDKNIGLQTKVDLLSQEYQSICGAMTVTFNGTELTLPEMGKFLLETDRDLRHRAWQAAAQRRLKEQPRLDELFNQMLVLRDSIARNAGFDNFRDYTFKSFHRFDYAPRECFAYHQAIERLVVPLWVKILEKRKTQMKVDTLRPWDTSVDPLGRAPLKPFNHVCDLISGCRDMFDCVDEELGKQFAQMADEQCLDLASRKGKAPGGYQSTLNEARKPFIFMNAVGMDSDVRTLLHEGGHAFHALACASDPLLDYRHGPMEFNEVASMGMELLAGEHLSVFYGKDDMRRSVIKHLEDVIFTLVWVATIDAFQHWIYENPKHTQRQRREQWLAIRGRFSGGVVDWAGLEDEHAYLWHRQLHIFEVPFYYIEYGIAQLGALQLWLNSKKDQVATLVQYREALSLGGSKSLPELFKAAGLHFDFSEETIAPLVDAVESELYRLNM